MNKILVNKIKKTLLDTYQFVQSKTYSITIDHLEKELFLVIQKDVNLQLNVFISQSNLKVNIEMEENSHLTLNGFMIEGNSELNIILKGKGAVLDSNISVISKKEHYSKIAVKHLNDDTISNLKNHGFSLAGAKLVFDVSGSVFKDMKRCLHHQDNQIIEKIDSQSQINPNLYIDSYDVEASHSAYIGNFKEDQLFYLMSRGISKEDSYLLLLKAFLLGNMKDEEYEQKMIEYYHS